MATDQPAAHNPDALPPELQAAVEAARQPRSWTDFLPEYGPLVRGTGDPGWDEEAERAAALAAAVTPEELDAALEQWQEAGRLLFVLRLRSGR